MSSILVRRGRVIHDLLGHLDARPLSSLFVDVRLLRYFVAVAEERHFGRAAKRLMMTQPSLSRAIKQLEHDLGVLLLDRSPTGVRLTPPGAVLYVEACTVLDQMEHARARVAAAAGGATLTVGTLGTLEDTGTRLASMFRRRHPEVEVHIREFDFSDPTTGLRAGLVDVGLTRAPFDATDIRLRVIRSDPVGAVLRLDDPLVGRNELTLADLAERRCFRFPEGTDPAWSTYWTRGKDGPVVRTAHECLQAVLWNRTVGLIPMGHDLPEGLVAVEIVDQPPSELVIAWPAQNTDLLVRSFVTLATGLYREAAPTGAPEQPSDGTVGRPPSPRAGATRAP